MVLDRRAAAGETPPGSSGSAGKMVPMQPRSCVFFFSVTKHARGCVNRSARSLASGSGVLAVGRRGHRLAGQFAAGTSARRPDVFVPLARPPAGWLDGRACRPARKRRSPSSRRRRSLSPAVSPLLRYPAAWPSSPSCLATCITVRIGSLPQARRPAWLARATLFLLEPIGVQRADRPTVVVSSDRPCRRADSGSGRSWPPAACRRRATLSKASAASSGSTSPNTTGTDLEVLEHPLQEGELHLDRVLPSVRRLLAERRQFLGRITATRSAVRPRHFGLMANGVQLGRVGGLGRDGDLAQRRLDRVGVGHRRPVENGPCGWAP